MLRVIVSHAPNATIDAMAPPKKPRVPCPGERCTDQAPEGGLCNRCYKREWARKKNGVDPKSISTGRRLVHAPQEIRLRARVDDSGGPDSCHPWSGGRNEMGYGIIRWDGRDRRAHVVAWELAHGRAMRPGMIGCHTCDNPPCCNWRHVYEGTRATNHKDSVERGRAVNPPRKSGESHHASKMTAEQVLEARSDYDSGHATNVELARRYGITPASMHKIVKRQTWQDLATPERGGDRRSAASGDQVRSASIEERDHGR